MNKVIYFALLAAFRAVKGDCGYYWQMSLSERLFAISEAVRLLETKDIPLPYTTELVEYGDTVFKILETGEGSIDPVGLVGGVRQEPGYYTFGGFYMPDGTFRHWRTIKCEFVD